MIGAWIVAGILLAGNLIAAIIIARLPQETE